MLSAILWLESLKKLFKKSYSILKTWPFVDKFESQFSKTDRFCSKFSKTYRFLYKFIKSLSIRFQKLIVFRVLKEDEVVHLFYILSISKKQCAIRFQKLIAFLDKFFQKMIAMWPSICNSHSYLHSYLSNAI